MYMYQNKTAKDDSSFQSPERDLSKKRMTMVNGTGLTNIVVANSGRPVGSGFAIKIIFACCQAIQS